MVLNFVFGFLRGRDRWIIVEAISTHGHEKYMYILSGQNRVFSQACPIQGVIFSSVYNCVNVPISATAARIHRHAPIYCPLAATQPLDDKVCTPESDYESAQSFFVGMIKKVDKKILLYSNFRKYAHPQG